MKSFGDSMRAQRNYKNNIKPRKLASKSIELVMIVMRIFLEKAEACQLTQNKFICYLSHDEELETAII